MNGETACRLFLFRDIDDLFYMQWIGIRAVNNLFNVLQNSYIRNGLVIYTRMLLIYWPYSP